MKDIQLQYKSDIPKYEIYRYSVKRKKYCLCIPVINEGDNFKKFLIKVKKYSKLVDIVILDRGSSDGSTNEKNLIANSVSALLELTSKGRLSTQLRMGYAYALSCKYKGVITIDGNGKDNPKSIPLFIKALDEGYDYLQGSRFAKGGKGINTPILRNLGIRLVHAPLLSLSSAFLYTDTTPGFRGYSSKLLKDKRLAIFRNIFQSYELLAYISAKAPRLGFKTKEIPIIREYPKKVKTPTKIKGLSGNLNLFTVLIKSVLGYFDPI